MSLKLYAKEFIKRILASRGYIITNAQANRARMDCALQGIKDRNYPIRSIIDVGASDGRWSSDAMHHLKDCQYFLIEAQPVHTNALEQFCKACNNSQYVIAAAGDRPGQIYFDASHPMLGQASYTPFLHNNIIVPVTTIDLEIEKHQLPGPYLIKMDTHGFEVPILKGAEIVLTQTEVLIIECYNFKIAPDSLLFYEMCNYLGSLGFRCIDLVDPRHRVRDGVFWQADLVFVKADSPEFKDPTFDGSFGGTCQEG